MEISSTRLTQQHKNLPAPKKSPVRIWTRRIHIWIGLYLLFFLWLFSFSGLLLNHGKWEMTEFWSKREETTVIRPIQKPASSSDLEVARALMHRLSITGEINQTEWHEGGNRFRIQVARPGRIVSIEADFVNQRAEVKDIRVNGWGVMHMLHTFSGVRIGEPERQRDWLLTSIWSVAMDAVAIGLIVLMLSGVYIWYRSRRTKALGLLVLVVGCACCAFFLFGL